jgi:hypothetical protein
MMLLNKKMPVRNSPVILVNNISFSGQVNAENIQEQICAGLDYYPNECFPDENKFGWVHWLVVMVFVVVVGAVFFAMRWLIKRRPNQQQQIKEMVSQYVQFYAKE